MVAARTLSRASRLAANALFVAKQQEKSKDRHRCMLRIPNLIQWRLRVRNVSCDFNDNIVGDTARSQEVTVSQIPHNLDSEARAELLCYLVASQLTARALTGTWLSAPNVI